MPEQYQLSIDQLLHECEELQRVGIMAVLLFGVPEHKDELATSAYAEDGIVQRAVSLLKSEIPELTVMTDVCLCAYTSHGHCGVVRDKKVEGVGDNRAGKQGTRMDPQIDECATLDLLSKVAVSHARAGADLVAPSDMMDGNVSAIRKALDQSGYSAVPIMAYSVKYASAFYGPFREAVGSSPAYGDRRGYQMDIANSEEALREALLDIEQGADILMVKPSIAYLDIIHRLKKTFHYPIAAYNVSGEYAMVKAASACGWIDEESAVLEMLFALRRAGADIIITYWAKKIATLLT